MTAHRWGQHRDEQSTDLPPFIPFSWGRCQPKVGPRDETAANGPALAMVLNAESKRSVGRSQKSRPWVRLLSAPLDLSLCSAKSPVTQSRGRTADFGSHCLHSGFASRPAVVIYFNQRFSKPLHVSQLVHLFLFLFSFWRIMTHTQRFQPKALHFSCTLSPDLSSPKGCSGWD